MSTCCLICYRVDNYFGDSDSDEDNDDKTGKSSAWLSSLNQFFLLLERHLSDNGRIKNGGLGKGTSKPKPKSRKRKCQLRKVNVAQLIRRGLRPCEDCSKVAESFCSLYQEIKRLELLLQWKVWTLKNIMFCAQRVPVRVGALREFVAKMEGYGTDGGSKIEQVFQSILEFKSGLVKKCSKRLLNSFPKLTLNRRRTPAMKNFSPSRSDSSGSNSSSKRKLKDAISNPAKRTVAEKSTSESEMAMPVTVTSPKESEVSTDSATATRREVDKPSLSQSQKEGDTDTDRPNYKIIKIVEFDSESEFEVSVCNYGEKGKEDEDYLSDGNNHSSSDSDSDSEPEKGSLKASDTLKPPIVTPKFTHGLSLFGSNSKAWESYDDVAFQKEGDFTVRIVRKPKGQKRAIPPRFPTRPPPVPRFVFPVSCMPVVRILEPNRPAAFSNGHGGSPSSPTPVYADFDAFLSDLLQEDMSTSTTTTPTPTANGPQKVHFCSQCKIVYKNAQNLRNHRLKVHGAGATIPPDLMYRCDVGGCTSQFGTRAEFESHRRLHLIQNNETSNSLSIDNDKLEKDNDDRSNGNNNLEEEEEVIPKKYGKPNKSWQEQLKEMTSASGNAARKAAMNDVICLSDSE